MVDDNGVFREGLARALRHHGYDVATARDGSEALAALADPAAAFDVVVLDLVLPGASGLEILQAIRRNPRWSGLPVLLVTAAPEPALSVVALERGAADFVPKPFRLDELVLRIRQHGEAFRALRAARNEVERHRQLHALITDLLEGVAVPDLFSTAVRHLAAWAGVRCAYVAALSADKDALLLASSQPFRPGQRLPRWAYPELHLVEQTGRCVHVADVEASEAFATLRRAWSQRLPSFALRSVVAVPFGWRGQLMVLVVRAEAEEPVLGYGVCEAVEWVAAQLVRALVRLGEDAWSLGSA